MFVSALPVCCVLQPVLSWWCDGPLQDPYGRTTFHVIANKKALLPSAANASFFAKLLKTDIHAVVTQPDNYGWTAVHYAGTRVLPRTSASLLRYSVVR